MYRFGKRSLEKINTLQPELQRILHRAMSYQIMDFTVVWGYRGKEVQEEAYAVGNSTKPWPKSKHNQFPSLAVDVAPWPINWRDELSFARLAGIINAAASEESISIRWGGDWDNDGSSADQSLMDLGHVELTGSSS